MMRGKFLQRISVSGGLAIALALFAAIQPAAAQTYYGCPPGYYASSPGYCAPVGDPYAPPVYYGGWGLGFGWGGWGHGGWGHGGFHGDHGFAGHGGHR